MRYVDEFRDPQAARGLLETVRRTATRPWVIMDVCGGQTHGLLRSGLEAELQGVVELIHGPGCPVCVTPAEDIALACRLARQPKTVLASFGDMLRVPGRGESLLMARADGARVRAVYSPLDAVSLAREHPGLEVVFFAVGFETTAPATALAVLQAAELGLSNFSLLTSHVQVRPAMDALLDAADVRVQAFLAAGHVCTVLGFEDYEDFCRRRRVPIAITGFEPLDLLSGILECVRQLEAGQARPVNQYARSVRPQGNAWARELLSRVYQSADRPWRGFGVIPGGGLVLRPEWARFDARLRYLQVLEAGSSDSGECRSGEVLAGRIRPTQCPAFGTRCRPESPLGAPMVSSEGACAAYFQYASLLAPAGGRG